MLGRNSVPCSKCGTLLDYTERIRIIANEYHKDPQCSGSISRTVDGFSLCKGCYKEYNNNLLKFLRGN